MHPELSHLRDLTFSEKLQLVEDLWDDLAVTPDALPIPEWQKDELARRKASHQACPEAAISWEQAKRAIRGQDG
ncbi:MAG TPA: addiction module protein [Thermoguttaceae bacterium]|nr:addiction module protein [Thermoguttaceae bacterium]